MVSFWKSAGVLQPSIHIFKSNEVSPHKEVLTHVLQTGIPQNKVLGL